MAKFVYKMQNILNIKMRLETQAKTEFSQASARLDEEEDKLRSLILRRRTYEDELKNASNDKLDINKLKQYNNYIAVIKELMEKQALQYHYGAQNRTELKGLFRKSFILVGTTGAVMFAASQLLAAPLVSVFVGYDPELAAMTLHGFRIYAVAFLVCGFNIYGSAFFTALNNGKVSALISFMRTLVFETSTVMLLPIVWGIDGVWSAIIVAEACALVLTTFFLVYLRKPYGYA